MSNLISTIYVDDFCKKIILICFLFLGVNAVLNPFSELCGVGKIWIHPGELLGGA